MSSGSLPAACTASVWTSAPCAMRDARGGSATGWIAPVSLLASMSETRAGRAIGREQTLERGKIDAAVAAHRQRRGARRGGAHRIVLDRRDDDAAPGDAAQRQMVRLAAAAGEDDVIGRSADQGRYRARARPRPRGARRAPSDAPKTDCRSAPMPRQPPPRLPAAPARSHSSQDRSRASLSRAAIRQENSYCAASGRGIASHRSRWSAPLRPSRRRSHTSASVTELR